MAGKRTTLILDDESRTAARQLAERVSKRVRRERVKTLKRLFDLFEGNDAVEEVRRLKSEDQGF